MYLLTEDAVLKCNHKTGRVVNQLSQKLVTIAGKRVMVEDDPQGRTILWCNNISANNKPCTKTLAVQRGYSDLLRVMGKRISLDTVTGKTDGTLPGMVDYTVTTPGQDLVSEAS
jgi:hypothetical protein